MRKRTTIADVAARAGLSMTTVSLILNHRPGTRIAAETAERVRAIAKELNYRPNPAARTLRIGKTRTVGFVSDDVTVTRYASAMIRGLLDVAEEHDHTVLIAETGQHPSRLGAALDAMLDRQADGIVFGLMGARQIELPELPEDLPVVILNGQASRPYPAVLPDEYAAGAAIAQVLVDAGHREIAVIGRFRDEWLIPENTVTIGSRLAGIDDALERAGVQVVAQREHRLWEPGAGYDSTREILAEGHGLTALLCLNDNLAFGAYQALQEAGIRVPDDVSVVSFDDDELARYVRPNLTTARLPYEQMGRTAMELVLTNDRSPGPRLVPMPVQLRSSVRTLTRS
jgi:LacI family transcriptional regulator